MQRETAGFALQLKRLFLCCFGKLSLKRPFSVSSIALLDTVVLPLTFAECASFSSLIDGDRVRRLSLAFWAVSGDFFRCFHVAFHSADSLYNNQHKHIKIIIPKFLKKHIRNVCF